MLLQIRTRLATLPVFLLSSASLIGTVINLSIGIFLARTFNPDIYGQMLYFVTITNNIRVITAMGMGAKTIKDVADKSDEGDSLNRVFYSMLCVRLAVGSVLAIIVSILGIHAQTPFIAGAAFLAIAITVMDSFQVYFQGLRAARVVSMIILTQPLVYLALSLVWGYHNLDTALGSLAISYMVTLALTLFIAFIADNHLRLPRLSYLSFAYLRSSMREILTLFAMGVFQQLSITAPVLILGAQRDFAASAAISIVLNLVVQYDSVTDIAGWSWLLPSIRRALAASKDKLQIRAIFDDFTSKLMLGAIWLCAIMMVWPDHILAVLFPKYVDQASILSVAALLTPILVYFGTQAVCLIGIDQASKSLTSRTIQIALTILGVGVFSIVLTHLPIETKLIGIVFSYIIATVIAMIHQEYLIVRALGGRPPVLYYLGLLAGGIAICALFRQLDVTTPLDLKGVPGLVLLPLVSGLIAAGTIFGLNIFWSRRHAPVLEY